MTESLDTLLDAYDQIGHNIPLLQKYKELFDKDDQMKKTLAFIYADVLDFHRRAIRFFNQSGEI